MRIDQKARKERERVRRGTFEANGKMVPGRGDRSSGGPVLLDLDQSS